MTEPASSLQDQRLETAAAWHARLAENVGEGEWQAFTAWLEDDPQNRHAFDAVDAASSFAAAALASAPITAANVIALQRSRAAHVARRIWKPVGLAAAILIGLMMAWPYLAPAKTERIATAVGETRDVTLADGSTLHLNTDTAVDVVMGHGTRGARLEKGEALFEVAPDPSRPFDVDVGDRRVHVVGTAFDILRYDGRIDVTVRHGTVQVSMGQVGTGTAGKLTQVALHPGDQYLSREGSPTYQLVQMDPAHVAEWQQGRLVFDDTPLAQVAAELNRYFKRPVVINDAAVGSLRFSGVLKIDDELAMLRRLAAFVPVTVQPKEDQVVLERGISK